MISWLWTEAFFHGYGRLFAIIPVCTTTCPGNIYHSIMTLLFSRNLKGRGRGGGGGQPYLLDVFYCSHILNLIAFIMVCCHLW